MEGFLSVFSLLNNLCWNTFSFTQRTLLKILPKVKPQLHGSLDLYNVVLDRKNDILCPGNTKSMIKYLDILSPLGSKEETREWLREKSGKFCDHKIQKMFFSNYKYVIHRTSQSRSVETQSVIDEIYIVYIKRPA